MQMSRAPEDVLFCVALPMQPSEERSYGANMGFDSGGGQTFILRWHVGVVNGPVALLEMKGVCAYQIQVAVPQNVGVPILSEELVQLMQRLVVP